MRVGWNLATPIFHPKKLHIFGMPQEHCAMNIHLCQMHAIERLQIWVIKEWTKTNVVFQTCTEENLGYNPGHHLNCEGYEEKVMHYH